MFAILLCQGVGHAGWARVAKSKLASRSSQGVPLRGWFTGMDRWVQLASDHVQLDSAVPREAAARAAGGRGAAGAFDE